LVSRCASIASRLADLVILLLVAGGRGRGECDGSEEGGAARAAPWATICQLRQSAAAEGEAAAAPKERTPVKVESGYPQSARRQISRPRCAADETDLLRKQNPHRTHFPLTPRLYVR
jgi:hypothetical protein